MLTRLQWLAPNLVTAIGTIACVITHALFVWYSPSFDSPVPGWLNILTAFAVLFYNTMDSIDGKQARRTKASSPLGQLFDHGMVGGGVALSALHNSLFMCASPPFPAHLCVVLQTGCDGLQTLNITLQLVSCLRLGGSMTALLFVCSVQVPFFLAQWEEYHTHSIRTNLGWFGALHFCFHPCFLVVCLFVCCLVDAGSLLRCWFSARLAGANVCACVSLLLVRVAVAHALAPIRRD